MLVRRMQRYARTFRKSLLANAYLPTVDTYIALQLLLMTNADR
jgi:hypothetical protein